MEVANPSYKYPILLPKRIVKQFWPDLLNLFNQQSPLDIDQ
jgi:hypothetical protein